ncbi:hypothetical protein Pla144_38690 [Bythopirellula polymerisocia]|uniref:Uncharacterized protein n=1 Tax=Bythopirellula polymerisocia TaxID=2528003 RepID=A0A5C6CJN1_9BACT|nr:hypothetical protein Pla144_38690 [Bythopirellula polymerisocia]
MDGICSSEATSYKLPSPHEYESLQLYSTLWELVVPFSNIGLVCFVLGDVLAVHNGNFSDEFLFAIPTQGSSKDRGTHFAATLGYGENPVGVEGQGQIFNSSE